MTYSEIQITFGVDLTNETISFDAGDIANNNVFQILEQWTSFRSNNGSVSVGTPTSNAGERSAIAFLQSFNADYNVTGLFTTSRSSNIVTIASNQIQVSFDQSSVSVPAGVTFVVTNQTALPFFIDTVTFDDGDSPCSNVEVTVTTNIQADSYEIQSFVGGLDPTPVTTNPFVIMLPRGSSIQLTANQSTYSDTESVVTPPSFNSASIGLNIDDNPSGATVIVSVSLFAATLDIQNLLSFQYSLNGTSWSTNNQFTGLFSGSYTMYVRDQYGCVRTKDFVLDGFGINSPYLSVSKANSIRFKDVVVWGDCANYKNEENTLSNEEEYKKPYTEILFFQTCDIVTAQWKSNYATNRFYSKLSGVDEVISAEVSISALTGVQSHSVTQVSNFMRLKDKRDAKKFLFTDGSGRAGVYFVNGNLYDYDTNADIGDYALNGGLPPWGVKGNYLGIGGTWALIEDVIYSEELNAEVLVISGVAALVVDADFITSCFYNLLPYEVFEATIDMASFDEKCLRFEIKCDDVVFGERKYLSELCNVKVRHENTVKISYWNTSNTDVFFATGIKFLMRLKKELIEGDFSDESTTHLTDTDAKLLESTVHERNIFSFQPVTTPRMRQMIQAFAHPELYLDDVRYVKASIQKTGPLEDTNLYDIVADLTKAENVYNSDSGTLNLNSGNQEVPAIVDGGEDFVLYQ